MDIVHLQLISSMIEYFRGDAKRIQHFIKVYNFAAFLGRQEQIDEETLFILVFITIEQPKLIRNIRV